MKINKQMLKADLLLLFVAVVWGSGFIVLKDSLSDMTPMFLLAMRFLLSSLVLGVVCINKVKNMSFNDVKAGFIIGICLFGGYTFQILGLQYTTASNSAFLTAVNVILVPFIVWILYKKPPELKIFVASFITLIGVGFISLSSSFRIGVGDSLSLVCALFFALHVVAIERLVKNSDPLLLTLSQLFWATVFFVVFAFVREPIPSSLSSKVWYSLIYQAVVITVLGYAVQNFAQKQTSSSHTSIILSLEAFFAMILELLFLNGHLSIRMVFGSMFIFTAVILVELNFSKENDSQIRR